MPRRSALPATPGEMLKEKFLTECGLSQNYYDLTAARQNFTAKDEQRIKANRAA